VEVDQHKQLADQNREDIWKRFSKWMDIMQKQKARVGDRVYYMILKKHGWAKSNAAKEELKKDPVSGIAKMQEVLKVMSSIGDPPSESWYQVSISSLWADYTNKPKLFDEIAGDNPVEAKEEDRLDIIRRLENSIPTTNPSLKDLYLAKREKEN